jgi:hypothetical protein
MVRGLSDGSLRYRFESLDSRIDVTRPGAALDFVEVSVQTSATCPTAYRNFDAIAPFEFTLKLPAGRFVVDIAARGGSDVLQLSRAVSVEVASPRREARTWLAAVALAVLVAIGASGAFLYWRRRSQPRRA